MAHQNVASEQRFPAVTRAVIPAVGLGTGFLPATKAIPKEMLPIVDKPAIQYVVEEAASVGLEDVLMITGRHKGALEDHFDQQVELESTLEAHGMGQTLDAVRLPSSLASIHYIRQGSPRGLGHALLRAREYARNEPFAVLLGDVLIDSRDPLLQAMMATYRATGRSVVALMEVPPEQIHQYGCAAVEPLPHHERPSQYETVAITDLIEKPDPARSPSNLATLGRYVLTPTVFDALRCIAPARRGEIQLTDALQALTTVPPHDGGGVVGVVFRGRRYDTGDTLDYLKTAVTFATNRDDLGVPVRRWLRELVASWSATDE